MNKKWYHQAVICVLNTKKSRSGTSCTAYRKNPRTNRRSIPIRAFTMTTDAPTDRRLRGSTLICPSTFCWQKQPAAERGHMCPTRLQSSATRRHKSYGLEKQFDVLELPGNCSKFGLYFILHLAVLCNKIEQSNISSSQVPIKIISVI